MNKHQLFVLVGFFFGVAILLSVSFSVLSTPHVAQNSLSDELLTDSYVTDYVLSHDGSYDATSSEYVFNNETYSLPQRELRQLYDKKSPVNVLGLTSEPKKIIVDLAHQRVYAYEGDRLILNFLVSTGKWGATPPGEYTIWYKVRSQTMKGGNKELGTYYYLPNVQWIQYFNKGIGFHSTYWHNNFGHPMSHGCVNMTTTDAETLYHWASPALTPDVRIFRSSDSNPGTPVRVVNTWTI